MAARCEDHDENSSSSWFYSSRKKKLETECCFGKKTLLLFLLAAPVYIILAIVKAPDDLRSTVGIFTTITALYHRANNTNEERVGGNSNDDSSTNASATNIPVGFVATDSTVPIIFKNCSPEEPNVWGCAVGEQCTKLPIETDANDETWYCVPESYFITPTSSSSPESINLDKVRVFDTFMME